MVDLTDFPALGIDLWMASMAFSSNTLREDEPKSGKVRINIDFIERHISPDHYAVYKNILYPQRMFGAIGRSLVGAWNDIMRATPPRIVFSEDTTSDVPDLVKYGSDLSQWTFGNVKADLKKSRVKEAPRDGSVIIDGFVQVRSDKMIVTVDLSGSFNPLNPTEARLHRISVRFAKDLGPQESPKSIRSQLMQQRKQIQAAIAQRTVLEVAEPAKVIKAVKILKVEEKPIERELKESEASSQSNKDAGIIKNENKSDAKPDSPPSKPQQE